MPRVPNYPPYSPSDYSPPLSPRYASSYSSSPESLRHTSTKRIEVIDVEAETRGCCPRPRYEATGSERLEQALQDVRDHFDSKFAEMERDLRLLEGTQVEDRGIFRGQLDQLQGELMETILSLDSRVEELEEMSSENQTMLATNASSLKGIKMTADMVKEIKKQLDKGKSIKDILQIINSNAPAGTLQPTKACTRQQSSAAGARQSNPTPVPVPVPTVAQKGKKKAPARKQQKGEPAPRVNCEYCQNDLSINSIKKHHRLHCAVLKRIKRGN